MTINYEWFQFQMPFAELGYSKDYLRFLFDRLGLLGNMEEDFKDYKEQGFLHIEEYAIYKLSQTSVNDVINHILDVIDVLEYEIDKLNYELEQHQKQIKGESVNKYKEALETLSKYAHESPNVELALIHEENIIQELVDKETPMKPNKKNLSSYCSTCGGYVGEGKNYAWAMGIVYCKKCRQKIDWSEDE